MIMVIVAFASSMLGEFCMKLRHGVALLIQSTLKDAHGTSTRLKDDVKFLKNFDWGSSQFCMFAAIMLMLMMMCFG